MVIMSLSESEDSGSNPDKTTLICNKNRLY